MRDLLEGSSMENIVNSRHRIATRLKVSHITNKKLDFICVFRIFHLILMVHIALLLLITREYADLANISFKKTIQYCITK